MIKLSILQREQAMKEWPTLSGYLEKAVPYAGGRYLIEDIEAQVNDGSIMILVAWDTEQKVIHAVFGAEAFNFPRRRVFSITICGGGDIDKWGHLYPAFKEIARGLGFGQIEVAGRRGWKKFLPGAVELGRIYAEDLVEATDDGK